MTVHFYLKDTGLIMLSVSQRGRYRISTGLRIDPEQWNLKRERPKINNSITAKLDQWESEVYSLKEVSQNSLKLIVQGKKGMDWQDAFDEFIRERTGIMRPSTIKKYRHFLTVLTSFDHPETWSGFTNKWAKSFLKYMLHTRKNTDVQAGKQMKVLKTFLKWAEKRGYHSFREYQDFEAPVREGKVIRLTLAELDLLYRYTPPTPALVKLRDGFLARCCTGLRSSDFSQLRPHHIVKNEIDLQTIKTGTDVKIPLVSFASDLLPKYLKGKDYFSKPDKESYQQLKDMCRDAGITSPVTKVIHRGGLRIEKVYEKWELVNHHTARKTFITLSLEKGMGKEWIKKIAGIKDDVTLLSYMEVTSTAAADDMKRAWS